MAGSGTAHLRNGQDDALLRVEGLTVEFPAGRGRRVHAVSGVSFDVARGETLGIVGESGCGKSSAARAVLQLPPPTAGSVTLEGVDLTELEGEALRQARRRLQVVFQDPLASLNPRRRVRDIVGEGLRIWEGQADGDRGDRVDAALAAVGLGPEVAGRRPHELSGGQCQRVSIARALALGPDVLICDEPVSALDVSVQAQILNLLEDLKASHDFTLVFIAHDLGVVRHVSDRVLVLYLGKVCEVAPAADLFARPAHPYTRALLASIPGGRAGLEPPDEDTFGSELPSPIAPPSGCRFRTRCPRATDRCAAEEPQVRPLGEPGESGAPGTPAQWVACHHPHT